MGEGFGQVLLKQGGFENLMCALEGVGCRIQSQHVGGASWMSVQSGAVCS